MDESILLYINGLQNGTEPLSSRFFDRKTRTQKTENSFAEEPKIRTLFSHGLDDLNNETFEPNLFSKGLEDRTLTASFNI